MKEQRPLKPVRKMNEPRPDGYAGLRVSHRKARAKQSARIRIKCGDCDNAAVIRAYEPPAEGLEIGGVHASIGNWREILLPLLSPESRK